MKYTEGPYEIGSTEKIQINKSDSKYNTVTQACQRFTNSDVQQFVGNDIRQIWRNHILGESMRLENELSDFYSITIFPKANNHLENALPRYKGLLRKENKNRVIGIHFCDYIAFLKRTKLYKEEKYKEWIDYLDKRYLF